MGLPKNMKAATKFFLFLALLAATALLVLRFTELSVPEPALEHLSRKVSTEDWLIRFSAVKWSFPGRIKINGLRVLNMK